MEGSSAYTTPRLLVSVNQVRSTTTKMPRETGLVAIMPLSSPCHSQTTYLFLSSDCHSLSPAPPGVPLDKVDTYVCCCCIPRPLFWGACLPLSGFFRDCLATATLVESYHESRIFETLLFLLFGLKNTPETLSWHTALLSYLPGVTPSHFPPYFL